LLIVGCVIIFLVRRAIRRDIQFEMPEKINMAIADYFSLKDTSRTDI